MRNRQLTFEDGDCTPSEHPEHGHNTPKARPQRDQSTLSGLSPGPGGMFGSMAIGTSTLNPPISQLAESYLLALQAYRRRPATLDMYTRVLNRFVEFLDETLGKVPALEDLSANSARAHLIFLQQQPRYQDHPFRQSGGLLAPSTLNQHARCLRAFANWLYQEEYTDDHLLRRLKLPKVPKVEMKPLSRAEVRQVLASLETRSINGRRSAAIVTLLYDTGMRAGELVGMQLADIRFDTGEISVVGKGEKQRIVVAGRLALRALRRYLEIRREGIGRNEDRVFTNSTGMPTTTGDIGHIFRRLRRRCGIERLHAHLLRHSFAVQFLRNGGDVLTLQRLLGHSSVATTNRYVTLASVDLVNAHRRNSPLDNS
jgi:site-specific recombinase XerD